MLLAPMAHRLEGVHVGLLIQVKNLKAKTLRDGCGGTWRQTKYFRERSHNRFRPTWTGDRRQWRSGSTYGPFSIYV